MYLEKGKQKIQTTVVSQIILASAFSPFALLIIGLGSCLLLLLMANVEFNSQ